MYHHYSLKLWELKMPRMQDFPSFNPDPKSDKNHISYLLHWYVAAIVFKVYTLTSPAIWVNNNCEKKTRLVIKVMVFNATFNYISVKS
jgi:hypothetical protein